MANSGTVSGSVCHTGIYDSSACGTYWAAFYWNIGVEYWVTRTAGTRAGVVHYKLKVYLGPSGGNYYITFYDRVLNGGGWGDLVATGYRATGYWYDAGAETSQSFTYNDDGTAPTVWINGGGSRVTFHLYCLGASTSSLGGFNVTPDRVTVDWQRRPGSVTGSASNTTCTGATLNFNVGDPGIPSSITTQIQYGTTTSYGQSTASSSARSGSFTLSNLQAGTTYHYRVKTTNSTGTTYSGDYTFKTKGVPPSAGTPTATNPSVYRIDFTLPNIVWKGSDDCATTSRSATLTWKYTMDGRNYTFSHSWSGNDLGSSLTYSTGTDVNKVPDDETVTYTWTITTNIGSVTKSGTIYCQPSYEAWVCGPSTNYQWKECELYASEKAGVASYKKVRWIRSIT